MRVDMRCHEAAVEVITKSGVLDAFTVVCLGMSPSQRRLLLLVWSSSARSQRLIPAFFKRVTCPQLVEVFGRRI